MKELRVRLKAFHKAYGTPYTRIASTIGFSGGYLRTFVCEGVERISDDKANKLDEYLKERGF